MKLRVHRTPVTPIQPFENATRSKIHQATNAHLRASAWDNGGTHATRGYISGSIGVPARRRRGNRSPHDSSEDACRCAVGTLASMEKAEAEEDFGSSDKDGDDDENNDDPSLVWREQS